MDVGSSARRETWLWFAQRASALVLALCVVVHLVTIIYATRGGLTGVEILARTRGNAAWLTFYVVFVLAVAVHVPIGLRTIAIEWLGWRSRVRDWMLIAVAIALGAMGLAATWGMFY
ncbi:MAG TPA: succinate dehydrogenase [Burkholderiaceae bacterium]|nr:succinate dehydrogenase [Burkholderiaceae bacterium]